MGLDLVELIMAYEEAFKIEIPDREAEKMETMGLVHAFIVQATRSHNPPPDPDAIWKKMVEITSEQLSVDAASLSKATCYVRDLGCG